MTKLKSVLASLVLATLLHAHAFAQSVGQLGPGQLWANPTASQARGKATGLSPYFDYALGSTANGFPARISGNWTESLFGSSFAFSGSTLNLQPSAASTLGGVNSFTCGSHAWVNTLSTLGAFSCTQPALSDLPAGTQDTVLGYWTSTVVSAASLPNCSNALTYSTSTHTWGCNVSAGTGTVTSVTCGNGLAGGSITASGTCSQNAPNFKVHLAVSQSVTSGTTTKVNFDTVDFDTNSWWSSANHNYSPQIAGTYEFCAFAEVLGTFTVGSTIADLYISKNGPAFGAGTGIADGTFTAITANSMPVGAGCVMVPMNGSTDTVEVDVNVGGTSPSVQGIGAPNIRTYFTGKRISN